MAPPGPPVRLEAARAEAIVAAGESRPAAPREPGAEITRRRTGTESGTFLARVTGLERLVALVRLVGLLILGAAPMPGRRLDAVFLPARLVLPAAPRIRPPGVLLVLALEALTGGALLAVLRRMMPPPGGAPVLFGFHDNHLRIVL